MNQPITSIIVVAGALILFAFVAEFSLTTTLIPYKAEARSYTEIQAEITAYTASEDETDDRPWETASGTTVNKFTSACPEYIPFGTVIEIEDREYVCEDVMNKRYRSEPYFDIIKDTKEEAKNFGRQQLAVKIYE